MQNKKPTGRKDYRGQKAGGNRAMTVVWVLIMLAASVHPALGQSVFFDRPVSFTENAGQWDNRVEFQSTIGNATTWLTQNGLCCQIYRTVTTALDSARRSPIESSPIEIEHLTFSVTFVGANPSPAVSGLEQCPHTTNYYRGSDPSRWKTGVVSFYGVLYEDIYDGIDLKYYGNGSDLEYDIIVAPGSNPEQIRLRYDGVESVAVNNSGELEVITAWGSFTEHIPRIYQISDGYQSELAGSFRVNSDGSFGFEMNDAFDATRELIIDPVLTYSSYLGGSGTEYSGDIDTDAEGNVIVVGHTYSTDFPIVDPLQSEFNGTFDVFVTKIDVASSSIIYSTYLGGSGKEEAAELDIDAAGNMYVAGRTYSSDFPTVNAFQASLQGSDDIFVSKISQDGSVLLYSTYLGGSREETIPSIAVDPAGMAYISGITVSSDFPTRNAFDNSLNGGQYDGFVTKLNATGNDLVYSTYLGTNADEEIRAIAVNDAGEAVVVGNTYSCSFPAVNPLHSCQINSEGPIDAVITKFSSTGNTLEFSTFFGGTEDEWIQDVAFDDDGNILVVGCVESDDFPLVNPIQAERVPGGHLGGADMFASVIAGDGSSILFSTYLGGSDEDFGEGIHAGPDGSIYISGTTYSVDFPTADYLDNALGGVEDVIVAMIDPTTPSLLYSTYLGGSGAEYNASIVADGLGNAHLAGNTYSSDFPTVNATQPNDPLLRDVFVSTISPTCCSGIRGNFNGDSGDQIDLIDIFYSINWTFGAGEAPACPEEADVDGNGTINIEDLVYLIKYVYNSGPPPVSCY